MQGVEHGAVTRHNIFRASPAKGHIREPAARLCAASAPAHQQAAELVIEIVFSNTIITWGGTVDPYPW